MPLDIVIFALIAAFLLYRLNSVLGTRSGDERQRPNPFAEPPPTQDKTADKKSRPADVVASAVPVSATVLDPQSYGSFVDQEANKTGQIDTGIAEIASADNGFEVHDFISGAMSAFEMIVNAFARGDLETLEPLLSPRLYKDFSSAVTARAEAGQTMAFELLRIKSAKINDARMSGAMAYVTVAFEVEETTSTTDKDGKVIDGDPDRILTMQDVWTFSRDTRSDDPNWILIETRSAEK